MLYLVNFIELGIKGMLLAVSDRELRVEQFHEIDEIRIIGICS